MRESFFWRLFPFIFATMFIGVIAIFVVGAYLSYQCYVSGDPNSMACYMTSERLEIGVRDR